VPHIDAQSTSSAIGQKSPIVAFLSQLQTETRLAAGYAEVRPNGSGIAPW